MTGTEAEVGTYLGTAAGAVVKGLERDIGAVVSRSKSEILASTDKLRRTMILF